MYEIIENTYIGLCPQFLAQSFKAQVMCAWIIFCSSEVTVGGLLAGSWWRLVSRKTKP